MSLMDDLVFMFCPPFSQYKEQPTDQSKCELVDCPTCKQSMWLSEKKDSLKKIGTAFGKEVICECYDCFTKRAKENPELMRDHKMINI